MPGSCVSVGSHDSCGDSTHSSLNYGRLVEESKKWKKRAVVVTSAGVVAWLFVFGGVIAALNSIPNSHHKSDYSFELSMLYGACAVAWLVFTALGVMGILVGGDIANTTSYLKTLCLGAGIVMMTFYALKALGAVPIPIGPDGAPIYLPRAMAWGFARSLLIFALWASSECSQQVLQRSLMLDWLTLSSRLVAGFTSSGGIVRPITFAAGVASAAGLLYYKAVMFDSMAKACKGFPKARVSIRRLQVVHMVSWSAFPVINLLDQLGVFSRYQLEMSMAVNEFVAFALFAEAMGQGIVKVSSDRKTGRLQERSLELVKQLQDADKRKDRFFAAMSHELRTPLNGIIGLTESILNSEKDLLTEKATRSLTTVLNTAKRFGKLINTILDSASLKEKKLQLSLVPVSLFQVVEEAIEIINPLLSNRVKLTSQIPSNLPMLKADPSRLMQILYNVLGNAAKFCTEGSITIRAMQVGANMLIEVDDTGIGIPADKLSQVFEAFEQVDNSQSRGYGGTGLGLNLALNLAKAHNGDLTVRSTMGKGTVFTLQMPVLTEEEQGSHKGSRKDEVRFKDVENEKSEAAAQDKGTGTATDDEASEKKQRKMLSAKEHRMRNSSRTVLSWMGGPMTEMPQPYMSGGGVAKSEKMQLELLSVDDDPVNQEVMADLLSGTSYKITTAMSGIEALKILEERFELAGTTSFPDMILMDNMMPGMTGLEATRKIREIYPMAEMPIMMVTANDDEDTVCKALTGGANDFVKKPLRRSELKARVDLQLKLLQYYTKEVETRKQQQILNEILPPSIIERLSCGQTLIADELEQVTVLFSDIVGFTAMAAESSTVDLVCMLDKVFSSFDNLTDSHGVQKIETIGDCYMVAAGHDEESKADQASRMLSFAKAMMEAVEEIQSPNGKPLQIRIGIHSGPAYAGVVGQKIPRYCLFGDTVNTASRMESTSFAGCVQISNSTYQLAMANPFLAAELQFCNLGERLVKGKGAMQTWLLQEGQWEDALGKHLEQQGEDVAPNSAFAASYRPPEVLSNKLDSIGSGVESIGVVTSEIPHSLEKMNSKLEELLQHASMASSQMVTSKARTPPEVPLASPSDPSASPQNGDLDGPDLQCSTMGVPRPATPGLSSVQRLAKSGTSSKKMSTPELHYLASQLEGVSSSLDGVEPDVPHKIEAADVAKVAQNLSWSDPPGPLELQNEVSRGSGHQELLNMLASVAHSQQRIPAPAHVGAVTSDGSTPLLNAWLGQQHPATTHQQHMRQRAADPTGSVRSCQEEMLMANNDARTLQSLAGSTAAEQLQALLYSTKMQQPQTQLAQEPRSLGLPSGSSIEAMQELQEEFLKPGNAARTSSTQLFPGTSKTPRAIDANQLLQIQLLIQQRQQMQDNQDAILQLLMGSITR